MSILFPASLDSLTNPMASPPGSETLASMAGGRTHTTVISDLQDAVEAIEAKVGIDESAVTTSHDYKLVALSAVAFFQAENKQGSTINKGQPVAIHPSGTGIVLADATVAGKPCVGFTAENILNATSGVVLFTGPVSVSDWTAIAGSSSLSTLATYYLSSEGTISLTPPSTTGQWVQSVGKEVVLDTLKIEIREPFLL